MFTPLSQIKTAELPPPKNISVKEWDKILERGPSVTKTAAPVDLIRKVASAAAFEELTASHGPTTEELIDSEKLATVEDQGLLKVACDLHRVYLEGSATDFDVDVSAALRTYEELGGKYKHAFGSPMFDSRQLSGSPAVASGMKMRATAQMEQAAQPMQAPQGASPRSSAPSSTGAPRAPGGAAGPSTPSLNTAPPAAPTAAPAAPMV